MLPLTPNPPLSVSAPVTLLVLAALALNVALFTPAMLTVMEVALPQYSPELLAAKLYTPGAPSVPAGKAVACRSRVFRAPPRKVTVILLVPAPGAAVNSNVVPSAV